MLRTRCPTKGIHWEMLRNNQHIIDLIRGPKLVKPKLDRARVLIHRQPEIKESTP
jgi:hypothetical protein